MGSSGTALGVISSSTKIKEENEPRSATDAGGPDTHKV